MKVTLPFLLDRRKIKKDGTYTVKLRVYYNNDYKMYGLGRDITIPKEIFTRRLFCY